MSLLGFLSRRLLLLSLNVSVGIFYLVYILYQWGLDDSTEFYLEQDMQWAKKILAAEKELPKNTTFKQFYLSDLSLPKQYENHILLDVSSHSFFFQDEVYYHYGLHETLKDNTSITVIHKFLINGSAEGMSLFEVSMLASLILIIMVLISAWLIYQRIACSMQLLLASVSSEANRSPSEIDALSKTDFIEIENIVNTLQSAIHELESSNQQERLFIQTLSHELRTPMATIQVALELLLKKEILKSDLNKSVREKIEIIFNSNQQMQSLSHDLLSLWSNNKMGVSDEEAIDLEDELNEIISDLDNAFACKHRFIINTSFAKTDLVNTRIAEVITCRSHLRLLLNNLCKNAIVHSEGDITIMIASNCIKITNNKSNKDIDPLVAGSGIGLILAKKAAELINWAIDIRETDTIFELKLTFIR